MRLCLRPSFLGLFILASLASLLSPPSDSRGAASQSSLAAPVLQILQHKVAFPLDLHTRPYPMDDVWKCPCGTKTYSSEAHFSRHRNQCTYVLQSSRHAWETADTRHAKKRRVDRTRSTPSLQATSSQASTRGHRAGRSARGDGPSSSASSSHNRYETLMPDDPMVNLGDCIALETR